jgi:hypothetical protein
VGVSWMGGTDGDFWFCKHDMENLCDQPTFTRYTVDCGYAEYALVRSDLTFPLPDELDAVHVAPLLCVDPEKAALAVADYQSAIGWASQTALRDVIGKTMSSDQRSSRTAQHRRQPVRYLSSKFFCLERARKNMRIQPVWDRLNQPDDKEQTLTFQRPELVKSKHHCLCPWIRNANGG